MTTLEIVFGRKNNVGHKGPSSGNIFKGHTGQAASFPGFSPTCPFGATARRDSGNSVTGKAAFL